MITRILAVIAVAAGLLTAGAAQAAPNAEQAAELRRLEALQAELHPTTGAIGLGESQVTLNLGEDYYFLGAVEAERVLTEGWGNPPNSGGQIIGMIFPAGKTFYDDTWGAVLTYSADGYISDDDAATIDYAELLQLMRQGETEQNAARVRAGYDEVRLIGWAQSPSYDATRHSMIWAKELAFGATPDSHTLNYDVRVLGRRGVFSINIVTDMAHLSETGADATRLMNTVSFNEGARYTDYRRGDQKAAYGLAGLVAGGTALAVAKKVGLFGILMLVLKKGGVFILIALAGAGGWLKRQFSGRKGGEFGDHARQRARPIIDAEPDPGLAPIEPPLDDTGPAEPPKGH